MQTSIYWRETKKTLNVALPLIAANLVQASSGFIGTVMLAKLGPAPLAASGLVSSLYFALVVVCWGMLNSISVLISQAHGANQLDKISRFLQQGLVFGVLISVPMLAIIWVAPWVLQFSVKDQAILSLATQYLHAMIWIIVPGTGLVVVEQLFFGLQKTKVVMALSILSVPLEIAGSYVLIFGKLGFPQCGIAGIGYGVAFAYALVTLLAVIFIRYHKELRQYYIFNKLPKLELVFLKEVVRIGWPIGAMYGIEVSFFAVLALLMGHIGAIALASHQIVMQYLGVEIMITFGFMNATTILVGHAIGRKDIAILPCLGQVGMFLAFIMAGIVGIAYWLFPEWIVRLDIEPHIPHHSAILGLTSQLLIIAIFYQLAEAVRIVAMGALRGMKDTRFPMLNSLLSFWGAGFVFSYMLGIWLKGQAVGLWIGSTLGVIVGAVILALRYQRLATRYSEGYHLST